MQRVVSTEMANLAGALKKGAVREVIERRVLDVLTNRDTHVLGSTHQSEA